MPTVSIDPDIVTAVIFDMNGTMVQDGRYYRQAFAELFRRHGVTVNDDEYEEKVANHLNTQIWPAVFGRALSLSESRALSREKEQIYEELYGPELHPVRGLIELVWLLKRSHFKLAVATTAALGVTGFILSALHLEGAFDVVVTGNDVYTGKPNPEIYNLTLEKLGVPATQAIAFEDSPHGVRAAVAAGIATIGMATDYPADTLRELGVHEVISTFKEVEVKGIG